jgi:hypothetical protein
MHSPRRDADTGGKPGRFEKWTLLRSRRSRPRSASWVARAGQGGAPDRRRPIVFRRRRPGLVERMTEERDVSPGVGARQVIRARYRTTERIQCDITHLIGSDKASGGWWSTSARECRALGANQRSRAPGRNSPRSQRTKNIACRW